MSCPYLNEGRCSAREIQRVDCYQCEANHKTREFVVAIPVPMYQTILDLCNIDRDDPAVTRNISPEQAMSELIVQGVKSLRRHQPREVRIKG